MLVDIYILKECFQNEDVYLFLNKYLEGMMSTVDYYEYPQYTRHNEFETSNFKDMLSFILEKRGRCFRFYFRNENFNEDKKFGMIFLNKDHSLIFGISVLSENKDYYKECFIQDFHSTFILESYEQSPPDNAAEFKEIL